MRSDMQMHIHTIGFQVFAVLRHGAIPVTKNHQLASHIPQGHKIGSGLIARRPDVWLSARGFKSPLYTDLTPRRPRCVGHGWLRPQS
jgi:hypothetical protein